MFARTKRLMLRPAWQEDGAMIAALVQAERKVSDLFGNPSACDLVAPCSLDVCAHGGTLPRLLVLRRTNGAPQLIGVVALEARGSGGTDLVCWIARPYRRMGYGTEASRAMLDIAQAGLRLKRPIATRKSTSFSSKLGLWVREVRPQAILRTRGGLRAENEAA